MQGKNIDNEIDDESVVYVSKKDFLFSQRRNPT